ncbi:unnamed protein product [Phaedon cochleariae]|uniref:Uncharacterized protein n=1 Tax=Phaedon cochleariae TaxID=80249 RepID=A0A9N9WZP1_PHACE|nr:unnamed protein product [Phaedon cochleariae]
MSCYANNSRVFVKSCKRQSYNPLQLNRRKCSMLVIDKLTKSFSNGLVHGHGYFEQRAFSIKQLSVEVSDLHVGADGRLTLTCISTIPGYVHNMDTYADKRSSTVQSRCMFHGLKQWSSTC